VSVHQREEAVVARLHGLAPHLDGEPDPDFRAATRARLVAMAAVRTPEPAPATGLQRLLAVRAPDVRPGRWRSRLTAGLAGAALTVTALASLVAVADGARPGDLLYELKRGTEQSQLAVAGDSRGRTLLDFASTRLDELGTLDGDGDTALVLETLRTMDEQTAEGTVWLTDRAVGSGDAGQLDDLARWAAGQSGQLTALQPQLPQEATAAVGQSLALLTAIGTRTGALDTALACPGGPAVAGTDRLGPVPAPCPTPEPPPPATSVGAPAPTTQTGQGAVPSTSAQPAPQPAPTPAPGTTPGGNLPVPSVPAPSPGGVLPSLPPPQLPLPTGQPSAPSSAIISIPPVGPVTVCAPPLITIGC
jgi:Domain of unknown function (DUF5667)